MRRRFRALRREKRARGLARVSFRSSRGGEEQARGPTCHVAFRNDKSRRKASEGVGAVGVGAGEREDRVARNAGQDH
jgi:hypothetical protein